MFRQVFNLFQHVSVQSWYTAWHSWLEIRKTELVHDNLSYYRLTRKNNPIHSCSVYHITRESRKFTENSNGLNPSEEYIGIKYETDFVFVCICVLSLISSYLFSINEQLYHIFIHIVHHRNHSHLVRFSFCGFEICVTYSIISRSKKQTNKTHKAKPEKMWRIRILMLIHKSIYHFLYREICRNKNLAIGTNFSTATHTIFNFFFFNFAW